MNTFLVWTLLGLIAGVLAKMIMPGNQGGGLLATIILGILGSIVGGWLGSIFGVGTVGAISVGGIFTAVIGALVLLFLWNMVTKQRPT